jgi:hypothetical protein
LSIVLTELPLASQLIIHLVPGLFHAPFVRYEVQNAEQTCSTRDRLPDLLQYLVQRD